MSVKKEQKKLRKEIKERVGVPYAPPELGSRTKDETYLQFIDGLVIEFDFLNYPNSIFFFRENICMYEYDMKTKDLWVDSGVWTDFSDYRFLEKYDVEFFIQGLVKKYFHLYVNPKTSNFRKRENFKKIPDERPNED